MPTASAELITARLRSALDVDLLSKYRSKLALTLGVEWTGDEGGGVEGEGDWPIWPDFRLEGAPIGRSRPILDAAYQHVTRLMSSEPEPEFPQVSRVYSETRKEFFKARARNDYGELQEDMANAYQDGLLVGRGVCEAHMVDVERGEDDQFPGKYQRVCLTHYPVTGVCFDPYERNLTKSRFIGLMRLVRLEDAEDRWGKAATDEVRRMQAGKSGSSGTRELAVVPVTTYYDCDYTKGRYPTRAIVLGNIGNAPIETEESGFDFIPVAMCLGFLPGGMGEHVGTFDRMVSIQEAISEWEKKVRFRMNQPDILFVDPSQMDEKDIEKLVSKFNREFRIHVVRTKMPQGKGMEFVKAPGLDGADMAWGDRLERMRSEAGGMSEISRGVGLDKVATKYEVEEVQQADSLNATGPKRMALDFMRRCIDVTLKVAAVYDTDPVWVDVDGVNVLLNDPASPETSMAEVMREPSRIALGTDSVTVADDAQKRQRRYAEIKDVGASFPMNIDQAKVAEEAIKALKVTDSPEDWLVKAQPGLPPGAPPAA